MTPNEWANHWRNMVGVNVIPAVTATKKPKVEWKQWQTEPIPESLHDEWIANNTFKDGMAIICGRTWHKPEDLWLNGIDCDNRLGLDEVCSGHALDEVAADTVVEQHANKDKGHILFYTKQQPIQHQAPLNGEDVPRIEIKSGGRFLLYCAGGTHKDGSPIEIIDKTIPSVVDKDRLEKKIDEVFQKYGLQYLQTVTPQSDLFQKPVHEVEGLLYEGENRGLHILSYIDSKRMKNPELTEDDLIYFARKYEREHCVGQYDDSKIIALVKQAINFTDPLLEKRKEDWVSGQISQDSKTIIDDTAMKIEHLHKFVTVRSSDDIFLYDGQIYKRAIADSVIKEETEKIVENCKTHHTNEVINKIKRQTYIEEDEFDSDSNLITIPNGILNLKTLELGPHTSDNLSRVLLPCNFIKPEFEIRDETIFTDLERNLSDTLFWQFLQRSFTVDGHLDKEKLETVLEMTASVFVKNQIDQRAFIHLGGGENGKSVFLEYFEHILGTDNISNVTLQDISTDTFLRAELDGMSANIFSDLEQNELKKSGIIKDIISGDPVSVQRKHQQPFKMHPFAKIMFSCNRFPKVFDQSQGFFRRWIIVKWERNFEGDPERDPHLREKLKTNHEERDKVFSCLLFLSRLLVKQGTFTHSKNWRQTRDEWNKNADPIDDFVGNHIVEDDGHTPVRKMYQHYKAVMIEKSETPLGIGRFGKVFAEYFNQEVIHALEGSKSERVWMNVSIKKPVQTKMGNY